MPSRKTRGMFDQNHVKFGVCFRIQRADGGGENVLLNDALTDGVSLCLFADFASIENVIQ